MFPQLAELDARLSSAVPSPKADAAPMEPKANSSDRRRNVKSSEKLMASIMCRQALSDALGKPDPI
jgi:hypothetical protein